MKSTVHISTTSKPIRVVHMTSAHPADDVRIFQKQCLSLVKNGYEVVLISPDMGDTQRVTASGVTHIALPQSRGRLSRMSKTVFSVLLNSVKARADVYHFHDPELIIVGLLLRAFRKVVIYDAHEDLEKQILGKYYIPRLLRRPLSSLVGLYESITVRALSAVIGATPHIGRKFTKTARRSVTINNYPILVSEDYTRRSVSSGPPAICYVGSISKIRGVASIVDALDTLNCQLQLAGRFSPETFSQELEHKKGWDKVRFHGFISSEEVARLYCQCSVGLVTFLPLPNHIDSQPNKIFEYMAAGLPVVASNFPLWTEIIEGNQCGICVDPTNPKAISDAVSKLLDDARSAEKMGENGKKVVATTYNWGQEEKKLFNLYSSLLSNE